MPQNTGLSSFGAQLQSTACRDSGFDRAEWPGPEVSKGTATCIHTYIHCVYVCPAADRRLSFLHPLDEQLSVWWSES